MPVRAAFRDSIINTEGQGIEATITVRDPNTDNPISETIYSDAFGGGVLGNPFTTDAVGRFQFYLDKPKRVDLYVAAAGYTPYTVEDADVLLPQTTGMITYVVAASDSRDAEKLSAHYVCNGTNDEATIQEAVDALPSQGGRVVLAAGTYYLQTAGVGILVNKRIVFEGYGALLLPSAGVTALKVRSGAGNQAVGMEISGLYVDGQNNASTVGLELEDSDRIVYGNFRIARCATGVLFDSASEWAEECALRDGLITQCTTGIAFVDFGGTGSFAETYIEHVGIQGCATGIDIGNGANLYRSRFLNVVIWLDNNGTGIALDGGVQEAIWDVHFETLEPTPSGITAISIGTNATGTQLLHLRTSEWGGINTMVSDAFNKGLAYWSGQDVYLVGNTRALKVFGDGDTEARVEVAYEFAGGGGLIFGPGGSVVPDTYVYRRQANCLATDGGFRPGVYTIATKPAANYFPAGTFIYVSDEAAGQQWQGTDGAAWRNLG